MSRPAIPTFHVAHELTIWIRTAHWISLRSHFFDPKTMKFFDSRLATVIFPLETNLSEQQRFTVVVSNRYRDPHDPALDGKRVYRVVLVTIEPDRSGERWSTTADYLSDEEYPTIARAKTAARQFAAGN